MAILYISEYSNTGKDSGGRWISVAQEPPLAEQTVAITAGSLQSAALNAKTTLVRLHTDAVCSIGYGTNPTASATSGRMAANTTEYIAVDKQAGTPVALKIAVITNA